MRARDASPADAPALAPLLAELGYPDHPTAVASRLAALAGDARVRVRVLEDAGAVIALAVVRRLDTLHRADPLAFLDALVVSAAARGRGAGRLLVDDATAIGAAWGCGQLRLSSNDRRADAHRFYEHLGFRGTSRLFVRPIGAPA
ncbi:MAG: GNAT family N-acetyltransferase [Gemmatimonadales bacterium]|nr:GNAT family N-acetyltransferase [Gemmatimonadales bacterium]